MTRPLEVVGLVEIATMLGVDRPLVRTWYARGKLPVPDARLAATPVWRTVTIQRWWNSCPDCGHVDMTGDGSCDKCGYGK